MRDETAELREQLDLYASGELDEAGTYALVRRLRAGAVPAELDERLDELVLDLAADHGLIAPSGAGAPLTKSESEAMWAGVRSRVFSPRPSLLARVGAFAFMAAIAKRPWYLGTLVTSAAVAALVFLVVLPRVREETWRDKGGSELIRFETELLLAEQLGGEWRFTPLASGARLTQQQQLIWYLDVERAGYVALIRLGGAEVELLLPAAGADPVAVGPGRQSLRAREAGPAAISLARLSGEQTFVLIWSAAPISAAELKDTARRVLQAGDELQLRRELAGRGIAAGLHRVVISVDGG